jgi:hypothetical protein
MLFLIVAAVVIAVLCLALGYRTAGLVAAACAVVFLVLALAADVSLRL